MDTQRVEEQCPTCFGVNGHHDMNCPTLTGRDAKVTQDAPTPAVDTLPDDDKSAIVEHDERNPAEGNDEIPPMSKELSQEQIQDHFDEADELFAGKKFEDGAVVDEEVGDGVALQSASHPGSEGLSAESLEELEVDIEDGVEDPLDRLPPTDDDVESNELLWLVAKTCHEVNRAYCKSIGDHSHMPWEETRSELRASAYDGVVKHFENPDMTPEDSHGAWLRYKTAEGWKFGNMKDVEAKIHPCMVPYYQLHAQDRAKDELFAAVCKSMFGGEK